MRRCVTKQAIAAAYAEVLLLLDCSIASVATTSLGRCELGQLEGSCADKSAVWRTLVQGRNAEAVALYNGSLKAAFAHLSEHPELKPEWAAPLKGIALRAKELKQLGGLDHESPSEPMTPRECHARSFSCVGVPHVCASVYCLGSGSLTNAFIRRHKSRTRNRRTSGDAAISICGCCSSRASWRSSKGGHGVPGRSEAERCVPEGASGDEDYDRPKAAGYNGARKATRDALTTLGSLDMHLSCAVSNICDFLRFATKSTKRHSGGYTCHPLVPRYSKTPRVQRSFVRTASIECSPLQCSSSAVSAARTLAVQSCSSAGVVNRNARGGQKRSSLRQPLRFSAPHLYTIIINSAQFVT
eukprot:COSAG02_NODE_2274_length_9257_cov_21.945840_8_plen_356_part_00